MLKLVKNLRIGVRLGIALVPAVACLVLLSGGILLETHATYTNARSLGGLIALTGKASALIHELQKERGASNLFLGSKGTQFAPELAAQRQLSDGLHQAFALEAKRPDAAGDYGRRAQPLLPHIDAVVALRSRIDRQGIEASESFARYTDVIMALLDLVGELSTASRDNGVNAMIIAYVNLLEGKERAGQERALGSRGFAAKGFAPEIRRRFVSLATEQEAFFRMYRRTASPTQMAALDQALSSGTAPEVERMRRAAHDSILSGAPVETAAPDWFRATTQRIDRLKEVEDQVGADLARLAAVIHDDARGFFHQVLAAALLGGGITVLILGALVRGITRPISRLTAAVDGLAAGNTDVEIPGTRFDDEIGRMARAMLVFRDGLIERTRLEAEHAQAEAREHELGRQLAEDAHGHLRGIVEISLHSNEVFSTLAILIRDVQGVASDSHSIAAAIEEMVTSVREIALNSDDAAAQSRAAQASSSEGITLTRHAAGTMDAVAGAIEGAAATVRRLEAVSGQIGAMIQSIEAIAGQTNLLALNATIEAARAGEAGKGFAVVAGEVKNLANQTARVTEDIRNHIDTLRSEMAEVVASMEASTGAVAEGRQAIAAMAETMQGVGATVGSVTIKMADIAGILGQQDQASSEVAASTAAIARRTEANNHALAAVLDGMDGAVKAVSRRIEKFAILGTDRAIVEMAKNDHCQFKNRILNAIIGRDDLRAEQVVDQHGCRFGKWYDSVRNPEITNHPAFRDIVEPHRQVHEHGRNAIRCARADDMEQALIEVQQMNEASNQVLRDLAAIGAHLETLDSGARAEAVNG